jgi:hypothetical protein
MLWAREWHLPTMCQATAAALLLLTVRGRWPAIPLWLLLIVCGLGFFMLPQLRCHNHFLLVGEWQHGRAGEAPASGKGKIILI